MNEQNNSNNTTRSQANGQDNEGLTNTLENGVESLTNNTTKEAKTETMKASHQFMGKIK
ncbi:hypothetical protein [Aneurinibacillus tyrosinisolvens]|uniref:hypothetical protein n=1 Tax=Aneurinibacillus tyrosinisolvens TaxID=1443435 RepID=UPI000B16CC72|nr:hypothetical protein [Aneurinibacillus tyrosinisolvens]